MSYIYHIDVLLSSIINQTNENLALTPMQARESHHTSTDMMHLTYVSVSYLSKVNLVGKVVHLVKTLVVVMSQCTTPTFSPYFCLAHIFKQACVMLRRKCKIQGNLCPIFSLCWTWLFWTRGSCLDQGS